MLVISLFSHITLHPEAFLPDPQDDDIDPDADANNKDDGSTSYGVARGG